MPHEQDDIYTGFVDEVEGYLPVIREGIVTLQQHPDNRPVLDEMHRLVHIIRGASGMLGIGGLSRLAKGLEEALEHAQHGEMALDAAMFEAMGRTADTVERYGQLIRSGGPFDDAALLAEVEDICAHIGAMAVEKARDAGPVAAKAAVVELDLDEELLASFNEEADEHFEELGNCLLRLYELVDGPVAVAGEVSELVRRIRRAVHTVKGASAVIGLRHIADMGHRIEDVLDWLYEGAGQLEPELLEPLGQALDQLERMVRTPATYEATVVEESLERLQEHIQSAPSQQGGITLPEEETVAGSGSGSLSSSLFSEEERQMLREGFLEETEEHLQELHRALQVLEERVEGPTAMDADLKEELRSIRRAVHTIKGAAAVIGMEDISGYAHKVEDFLDWLFEEAEQLGLETLAALTESLDALEIVIEDPALVDGGRRQEIFARLAAARAGNEPVIAPAAVPETPGQEPISAVDWQEMAAETLEQEADALLDVAMPAVAEDAEELLAILPEAELDPADLSAQELAAVRVVVSDEAELQLEALHQDMQSLEASISQEGPLEPEARETLTRMQSLVLALRQGANAVGNGEIAAYAHMIAEFLQWFHSECTQASPTLVNALGDAVDVLGQLVENQSSVGWDKIEAVCDNLAAAQQTASGMAAIVPRSMAFQPGRGQTPALPVEAAASGRPEERVEAAPEKMVAERAAGRAATPERTAAAAAPLGAADAAKTIRIHQNQLDSLINLANELLVGVSGFDRNMGLFKTALEELDLTVHRLKDIALELETKFEVKALARLSRHFDRIEEARQGMRDVAGLDEFDSLELDRYTRLNLIIRSLNESTIDVAAIHANLEGIHSGLGGDINRQHRVVRELQVQMMRARLSPMSSLTPRLSRTMRDVSSRLQKKVRLVMEGDTVELDRVIWEKLADPFMHLVRNSVHHGIESEEERARTDKPAIATIRIAGQREGNHVVVRYSDDGQGLDLGAIRERARQQMGAAVDRLDAHQLTDLIFTPGFSTRKSIDQISGRGVGMDVVKQNVQELQGSIAVESRRGQGAQFTIRVPLTMGVIRSLLVDIDGITYGMALSDVQDIQRIERDALRENGQRFVYRSAELPLYSLALLLGRQENEEDEETPLRPLVCITETGNGLAGVHIPHIAGQKEVVLKGLGNHLRSVTGIAGAAVLGDGSVIPLLNMAELIAAYQLEQVESHIPLVQEEAATARTLTIMIVDDSISIRKVMSRLVSNHGWIPVEAKDGQDAFEQLDSVQPDCILLDIEMPRMNGFEFLTLKNNLPEHKDIPVIMLTSRSSDKHRHKAMELGASVFLNKPTRDEDFVDAVLRLTGHRRTQLNERQREVSL